MVVAARPHRRRAAGKSPALRISRGASPIPAKDAGPCRLPSMRGSRRRSSGAALYSRLPSRGSQYPDRLLSAMRYQFGGHLEKGVDPGAINQRPPRSSSGFLLCLDQGSIRAHRCRSAGRPPPGPGVPGQIRVDGVIFPRIGSTMRHCASTRSCRENSSALPRLASPSSRS